ncbi:GTP cyclohydrolase II [Paenibacillus sp. sptzw28]|uniref:GTP cyclohydrolase II n=1 Tax=Paenibacillus sp. sptzw28 TaxID=715179 RepID=UPI001C6F1D6F|nr:GTP cyclohydrolase II [Paenibacillus sp. sptzw28]QYR22514.1 GTP cyclohydrolase II [Paenibacillus sp. sptzw28]
MNKNQVNNALADKTTILKQQQSPDIALVGPVRLPVQLDDQEIDFKWYSWLNLGSASMQMDDVLKFLPHAELASYQQSSVLVYGDFANRENALIRMHSICHTGDIFGSKRCDCGYQLRKSMRMIVDNGCGALFYLANHEGRGIGLFSKSLAYILQDEGCDTVEANLSLGFADDQRSYEEAIRVLQGLRQKPVSLITNNPRKLQSLREKGLLTDNHVSIWGDVSKHNTRYLATKVEKSGHIYNAMTESVKLG